MALTAGNRFGPYEIAAQIGKGGMGVVYRARDTRLKRDVALKFLPESLSRDPERLGRFRREAEILASLNHPNIAAIHGLEESDGILALVLELVEGGTLADRIAEGPIPIEEALTIARQIAEALEAAHDQGIVHRDLKPANIKVRDDGNVKVLDFGLAKMLDSGSATESIDATHSPTLSVGGTHAGVILGTAAYMAPEQAKGRLVDKRSDVWAFGCVLYEMLTGRRAFEGEDLTEIIGAVVRLEPNWAALPAECPPAVRALLKRCLEKARRRRIANISTALVLIEEAPSLTPVLPPDRALVQDKVESAVANVRRELIRAALPRTLLIALGAALLAGAGVWWTMRPTPPPVVRTEIVTTGDRVLNMHGFDRDVAVTPDGSRIVYRGDSQLFVRALDQLEPGVLLSGLAAPRSVFVSPDGQWVGFAETQSTLKKVAIGGGPAVTIARMDGAANGATWLPDDTVIFATGTQVTGLQRVSAAGGEPMVLTRPNRDRGEADHVWPEVLPDGLAVLFTITPAGGGLDTAQIAVFDLTTGMYKVIVRGGHHAHFVRTGHLVYGVGGTLLAVAFDLDRREIVGTPVRVLEGVVTTPGGAVDAAVAANGTIVYVPGRGGPPALSLVWVDRMGREELIAAAPPRNYAYARLSPDGTRIALDVRDEENDIWLWDLMLHTMRKLTFDPGNNRGGAWSPDGERVAFTATRDGHETIYWQAADGTGAPERLTQGPVVQLPSSFSPDGKRLIFNQPDAAPYDIGGVALDGERRAELILRTPYNEQNGEISPDGQWLAYQSNESGRDQIHVRPFPNIHAGQWQVSADGGTRPVWARNGRELFYFVAPGTVMTVPVQSGPSFAPGAPQALFTGAYGSPYSGRHYDVSPDGGRFLMLKNVRAAADATPVQSLIVVQNWDQELKRLVPAN